MTAKIRKHHCKFIRRGRGILAHRHRYGACMTRLAEEKNLRTSDADNFGDDTDDPVVDLQHRTLFDMRLDAGDVPGRIKYSNRPACVTGVPQGVSQHGTVIRNGFNHLFQRFQPAVDGTAEQPVKTAFFVTEREGFHADVGAAHGFHPCPGYLQAKDDAQCPVQPPALGNGIRMRADNDVTFAARCFSRHVADTVNSGIKPGLLHALQQPGACGNIFGRETAPVYAGFELAEFGERLQISNSPVCING